MRDRLIVPILGVAIGCLAFGIVIGMTLSEAREKSIPPVKEQIRVGGSGFETNDGSPLGHTPTQKEMRYFLDERGGLKIQEFDYPRTVKVDGFLLGRINNRVFGVPYTRHPFSEGEEGFVPVRLDVR